MKYVIFAFTFVTYSLLLADAFFYPTFSLQKIHTDALFVFLCYTVVMFLTAGSGIEPIPARLARFHKRIIFPALVILSVLFFILEALQYNNFVFSRFHIHPFAFVYLPILSGQIAFLPTYNVNRRYRIFWYVPPIVLFILFLISFYFGGLFTILISEDHVLEYAQFAFFVLAGFYGMKAFLSFRRMKNRKMLAFVFGVCCLVFFFIAGEEVSWGQRLLGIQTPAKISAVNVQNEITVHNLAPFQHLLPIGYIVVGLYGSFSRYLFKHLFPRRETLLLLAPPTFLFFPFFIAALFYFQNTFGLYTFAGLNSIPLTYYPQMWQEAVEVFFAFGCFGYMYWIYTKQFSS